MAGIIKLGDLVINCVPNITKNNVMKKSLNGLILLLISNLYGKLANDNPAKNAPISIENPIYLEIIMNKNGNVIELKNNNSCDLAILLNKLIKIYLLNK